MLGLAEPITRAIGEEGYEKPTPIQAQAIPPVMAGRDLVGIAQTGTGKTAAFALPILNRLAASPARPQPKSTRVVVMCPTRELGSQIVDSFHAYGRHLRLRTILAIGGVPIGKQIRGLAPGVDILVATPGRLLDLHNSRAVRFDNVEVLVLDEADRMLDMGFIRDIRKIVALISTERQTLFFSATMAPEIAKLADAMLREPVTVAVTPAATTVELIEQRAIRVDGGAKPRLLAEILKKEPVNRALVFTRTKHGADRVVRGLVQAGIPAEAIHGNKTQGNRDRTMNAFREGKIRTLVATDIAARGIDVDGVSHVINYDLPNIPDTYVHRIGRTARAGASGVAISLVTGEEMAYLRDIEKLIRMQVALTGGERTWDPMQERGPQRGRGARPQRQRDGDAEKRLHGDRPKRDHAKRGQGKHRGQGGQGQHGRPNGGRGQGDRQGNDQRRQQPSPRSNPGEGIGGVGFMNKPRRPGMQQGSASRPGER
jgi:superfamily II DNA/RNA helicase